MPSTPRMLQIEAKASQPGEPLTQAEVTAELVRSILDYDPETGVFTWRVRDVSLFPAGKASPEHKAAIWNKRWPGTTAGTPGTGGYVLIAIRDRLYKAHRLAWLYMYGRWPIAFIDHINGDTSDNRLANLREATKAQNSQNRAKQKTATSSRYLGVSWVSSKRQPPMPKDILTRHARSQITMAYQLDPAVHEGKAMGQKALYFGCFDRIGHFLYDSSGFNVRRDREVPDVPWAETFMDAGLLKNGKHKDVVDGRVFWTCGGAWTFWYAFVWWDRSVDSRSGSNSGFYVRGFGWPEARAAFAYACEQFPKIVARQKAPLVLQMGDQPPVPK